MDYALCKQIKVEHEIDVLTCPMKAAPYTIHNSLLKTCRIQ